jgi:hypothetical protein
MSVMGDHSAFHFRACCQGAEPCALHPSPFLKLTLQELVQLLNPSNDLRVMFPDEVNDEIEVVINVPRLATLAAEAARASLIHSLDCAKTESVESSSRHASCSGGWNDGHGGGVDDDFTGVHAHAGLVIEELDEHNRGSSGDFEQVQADEDTGQPQEDAEKAGIDEAQQSGIGGCGCKAQAHVSSCGRVSGGIVQDSGDAHMDHCRQCLAIGSQAAGSEDVGEAVGCSRHTAMDSLFNVPGSSQVICTAVPLDGAAASSSDSGTPLAGRSRLPCQGSTPRTLFQQHQHRAQTQRKPPLGWLSTTSGPHSQPSDSRAPRPPAHLPAAMRVASFHSHSTPMLKLPEMLLPVADTNVYNSRHSVGGTLPRHAAGPGGGDGAEDEDAMCGICFATDADAAIVGCRHRYVCSTHTRMMP